MKIVLSGIWFLVQGACMQVNISPPFEGGVAGPLIINVLHMLIPAGVVDSFLSDICLPDI